jgi:hypothetical protein
MRHQRHDDEPQPPPPSLRLVEVVPPRHWPSDDQDLLSRGGRHSRPIRTGFMLDVVGYGARPPRARQRAQERVAAIIHNILGDLDVRLSDTDLQGTGDGVLLFLPSELDVQRTLPVLLHSAAVHLAEDNEEFHDRIRIRMAVDIGPVGLTQLGFSGATATRLGRLLDSEPLRGMLLDHPDDALAVIVSDRLHSFVVAEGVPALPPAQFTRVAIKVKEFSGTAWLWTTRPDTSDSSPRALTSC